MLDRGGMRRTWLRGPAHVDNRDRLHVAGYDLGLVLRLLTGHGMLREAAGAPHSAVGLVLLTDDALIVDVLALVYEAAKGAVLMALVSARLRDDFRNALPGAGYAALHPSICLVASRPSSPARRAVGPTTSPDSPGRPRPMASATAVA
jgi:hypothetical protein